MSQFLFVSDILHRKAVDTLQKVTEACRKNFGDPVLVAARTGFTEDEALICALLAQLGLLKCESAGVFTPTALGRRVLQEAETAKAYART